MSADCDCACPAMVAHSDLSLLPDSAMLQGHLDRQQITLSPEYTVVFVPSVSRVAVMNLSALQLLAGFDTPAPVPAAGSPERAAVTRLHDLGFLQINDTPPASPAPPDELAAWLHVTNACNLRCTYCYIDKTTAAMSAETAWAAIDAVLRSAQVYGYRKVSLKYAGGEATLNLPQVEAMHRYAQERAGAHNITIQGVVLSNGVGLTRAKLQRIHAQGLRLMLSLDGPQDVHDRQRPRAGGQGSFRSVIATVERAKALGLMVTVSITVTGASVQRIADLVAWLLEHEVHFTLNFYRECDSSTAHSELQLQTEQLIDGMRAAYSVIEQRLPRYSLLGCLLDRANLQTPHQCTCGAGKNYLVINHEGGVARCQMEIASPITTVWDANPLETIRQDPRGVRNPPVDAKTDCQACEWKYWCSGGCALATYRATGRYDLRSPHCEVYQALYPEVIRLEGLRLLRWKASSGVPENL